MAFTNKTAEHIQAAVDAAFAAKNFTSSQPEQQAEAPHAFWLVEEFAPSGNSTGRYMLDQCELTTTTDVHAARKFKSIRVARFRADDMTQKHGTEWRNMLHGFVAPPAHPPAQPEQPAKSSAERTLKSLGYTDCGGEYWQPPLGTARQQADPELEPDGTEADVCADILKRQQLGINKYGTTVRDNPLELREWLQHAYEECLDQAVYLKRAMEEIDWKDADAEVLPVGPSL